MAHATRYAVYCTPPPFSRLAAFGASILGYDCYQRTDVPHARLNGIDPVVLGLLTVAPRRYGFHATVVAPFALNRSGQPDLVEEIAAFTREHHPIMLGPLRVGTFGRFVVLEPAGNQAAVARLAASCVKAFDRHRAPLSSSDRERRALGGLTPRQIELMDRWGYPYVLDQYRFHMTLAGPIPDGQMEQITAALSEAFAPMAGDHFEIDALSLMHQADQSERFRVIDRYRLRG